MKKLTKSLVMAGFAMLVLPIQAMQGPVKRPAWMEDFDLDRALDEALQDDLNDSRELPPAPDNSFESDTAKAILLSLQEQRRKAEEEQKDDAFEQAVALSLKQYEFEKKMYDVPTLNEELLGLIKIDGPVAGAMDLITRGAQVNVRYLDGTTPLIWAARKNNGVLCALLIAKSAVVNVEDHEGKTPLDYAIEANSSKLSRLLIDRGADLNPTSKIVETTLLGRALLNKCDFKLYTLLCARGAKL